MSSYVNRVGSCEHGNEPPVSIKGEEFLEKVIDYCFSKRTLLRGVSYVSHAVNITILVYTVLIPSDVNIIHLFTDFLRTRYERHATRDLLVLVIFNLSLSTTLTWWSCEVWGRNKNSTSEFDVGKW